MISTFKVGDVVKFLPGKFLSTVLYTYSEATETEFYRVISFCHNAGMVDITPLRNPHIKIIGVYSHRFQKTAQKIARTKPL